MSEFDKFEESQTRNSDASKNENEMPEFVSTVECSASDKGISLSVKEVLVDGLRIVLTLEECGSISEDGLPDFEQVYLTDASGKEYNLFKSGGGHPFNNPGNEPESSSLEFQGSPLKNTTLTLEVKSINGISGYWKVVFPVSVTKYENLIVNKTYNQDLADVYIKNIVFAKSIIELNAEYDNPKYLLDRAELSNGVDTVGAIEIAQEITPSKAFLKVRFAHISRSKQMILKLTLIDRKNRKNRSEGKSIIINIF